MTSLKIKFLVYERWGSITAAAREIDSSRSQLSYCISRRRISSKTREKLARALAKTVEELFGPDEEAEYDAKESSEQKGTLDGPVDE